jgi:hypothetical protein
MTDPLSCCKADRVSMSKPERSTESRRRFLASAAKAAGATLTAGPLQALAEMAAPQPLPSAEATKPTLKQTSGPVVPAANLAWKSTWAAALAVLAGNIRTVPGYNRPLLFEGSTYQGIWQECGPHEALVYATLGKDIPEGQGRVTPDEGNITPMQAARNNHTAFFDLQRPDGQLPAAVKTTDIGFAQIQMVVPIAATAWELAQLNGDEQFLSTAYGSCSRWDAWLRQYRDTRKTGLVEGFCTYDTGHDNSPRWSGIPNRCPDGDARKAPQIASMPRLCPDLSATVYGGRVALAAMAKALGKMGEAARWQSDAETIRLLILDKLYCAEDAAFYDRDAQGKFVRVRSDAISRVLGEHVLDLAHVRDRAIFEAVWSRQLHNPKAFWAPFPFSSIAMDDPTFVRPIPRNSWGGASQALTALRAPRWMAHYGKQAELDHLMRQWCVAILRHGEFRQQVDPLTGEFTQPDPGGYSPAALVFLSFASALGQSS